MPKSNALATLLAAAKKTIRIARLQKKICDAHPCPCVLDSYNSCQHDWQLSSTLKELEAVIKTVTEEKKLHIPNKCEELKCEQYALSERDSGQFSSIVETENCLIATVKGDPVTHDVDGGIRFTELPPMLMLNKRALQMGIPKAEHVSTTEKRGQ